LLLVTLENDGIEPEPFPNMANAKIKLSALQLITLVAQFAFEVD
jgi:hypothetical protein